jgi:hypothetical protein
MTMPTNPGAVTRARSDSFKRVTGASIGCSAGDLKGLAIAPSTVEDEGGAGGRRERLLATVANSTTNASYLWAASFVAVASLNAVGFGSGADWALSMVSVLETDSFATSLQEGLGMRALVVSDVECVFLTLAPTPLPSPQLQPEKSPGALASASTSSLLAVAVLLASGVAGVVWALKRKTHLESGDDGEADDWVTGGKAQGQGSRNRQPDSGRSTELELVDLAETLGGGEAAFAADPALGARRPTRALRSIAHLDHSGARRPKCSKTRTRTLVSALATAPRRAAAGAPKSGTCPACKRARRPRLPAARTTPPPSSWRVRAARWLTLPAPTSPT